MDYRSLGCTGMQVSPLCLGAMMRRVGRTRSSDVDRDHPPRAGRRHQLGQPAQARRCRRRAGRSGRDARDPMALAFTVSPARHSEPTRWAFRAAQRGEKGPGSRLALVLRRGTTLRAPSSTGGLRWRRWTAVVSNSATARSSRLYFEANGGSLSVSDDVECFRETVCG